MGRPMAKNLLKAGYSLLVYDIVGEAVEDVVTENRTGKDSQAWHLPAYQEARIKYLELP